MAVHVHVYTMESKLHVQTSQEVTFFHHAPDATDYK